ncbi:MAG TPA: PD-(D/E)XK nuclease family protein, partial [Myxococcota bacterium]|nr:PD-(D/E)XK nuclease family protein [Myxococcota bacterium]
MFWLDPMVSGDENLRRTLVLCRTAASANAVKRWIAARGGMVGVEVVTPSGLAMSLKTPSLRPKSGDHLEADPKVPAGHPWESVNARPGLAEVLKGHLADIRIEGLATEDLPAEVWPLLDAGWGGGDDTDALLSLVERIEAGGEAGRLGFAQVFAVGFGLPGTDLLSPPGPNRYFERLLSGLGAIRLAAPVVSPDATPETALAADVVSEAAWVVKNVMDFRDAGGDPEGVLVLFAGADDRDRIASALARSGIPAAVDQAQRLSRHALAILTHSILPWFDDSGSDSVILVGETMRKLFQSPLLGRASYQEAEAAALGTRIAGLKKAASDEDAGQDDALNAEQDDLALHRRSVTDALKDCHMIRGTLDAWIAALDAVGNNPGAKTSTRRAAILLWQRLEWLKALRGPTIGHLRAYLNQLSLVTFKDRVAMSIQKALGQNAARPATPDVLDDVLGGAVSSGSINRGVTLLDYANYDGRPSRLCLLTGMHSKGVGQAPSPDPFFTDDVAATWGRCGGSAYVSFLMAQAGAAAARAERSLACVVQRAADGRAAVPVSHRLIRLLSHKPADGLRNYGLAVETEETRNHAALVVEDAVVPVAGPVACGDNEADHAALMATVEWIRGGGTYERGVDLAPGAEPPADAGSSVPDTKDPKKLTLAETIATDWGFLPKSIRPYLGDGSAINVAKIARDKVLSTSSGFEPMTHCLFQAYLKTTLGLKKSEDLEEELSAAEVGTAVHAALEEIGTDPRWRPATRADVVESVRFLSESLTAATRRHLEDAVKDLPDATPALAKARLGLANRWGNHLKLYVQARVQSVEELNEDVLLRNLKDFKKSATFEALVADARSKMSVKSHVTAAVSWISMAIEAVVFGKDPADENLLAHCDNQKVLASVGAWSRDPGTQAAIRQAAATLVRESTLDLTKQGRIVGGAPEWKFGAYDG